MRVKLGTFYAHSSITAGATDNVQWSLPYVDGFGMGLMLTACKKVIVGGYLQGVIGFDITLQYLAAPVEYLVSETTYAFMITMKRGYMVYHPNFVNPGADIQDINPVHYSVFEADAGLGTEIDNTLAGLQDQFEYHGNRVKTAYRENDMAVRGTAAGTLC